MDVEEYRKQYTEMLEQSDEQKGSYGGFLDKSRPAAARLESLQEAPGLPAEDEVASSVDVIRDKNESADVRAAALQAISYEIGQSEELIDLTLALLQDNTEPPELRRSALGVLKQLQFTSLLFNARRPDYLAALRSVVEDPDAELREEALETLAQEKDEYAQRLLIEGLTDPARALVRPEKAIQLVGYDVHAEHFPILQEIVKTSQDPVVKQEAVRLLSADPTSTDLLKEVLQNKGEDQEVRRRSAIALQSITPEEFEEQAKQVILDDSEDDGLRAACVSALAHFGNHAALMQDEAFNERLDQIQKQGPSEVLDRAVQSYKANQDPQQ